MLIIWNKVSFISRLIVILLKFSQFSTFVLFYIDTLDKARRFCVSMRVRLILKLSTSDKIFMVVYIVYKRSNHMRLIHAKYEGLKKKPENAKNASGKK